MRTWPVQDAKTHFSELIRESEKSGPQAITWHGREVAVVLSRADYERLTGAHGSLVEFMRASPLYGEEEIEFSRDPSPTREVVI